MQTTVLRTVSLLSLLLLPVLLISLPLASVSVNLESVSNSAWAAGKKLTAKQRAALKNYQADLAKMKERCETIEDAAAKQQCLTAGYKELIKKYSKWKFGSLDPNHPDVDKIIATLADALEKYLEKMPSLADSDVTIAIVDAPMYKDGAGVSAWTTTSGQSSNITFYNTPPGAQGSGNLPPNNGVGLAQFVNEYQFDSDQFLVMTVYHELAHIKWHLLTLQAPLLAIEWWALWGASLFDPADAPHQLYYDSGDASLKLIYVYSVKEGFATATSYADSGMWFSSPSVWNFITSVDDQLE